MSSAHSAQNSTPSGKTISDIVGEAFRKEEFQTSLKEACRGKKPEQIVQEATMAVPMLLALTICPAMLGTQEAIRQSQSKDKREEHRARRSNMVVSCVKQSIRSRDIDGRLVVLKDNKLWITTTPPALHDDEPEPADNPHPFSGYFLPYPDTSYEGLVSTLSDNPPVLNWIYVDKNTYEVKYGFRTDAQEHVTGPFDCTRQDRRMTLEGWEGFVAVESYPGVWALYFDRDDDGLVTKVPMGTRVLEVELTRREKKERKPEPTPNKAPQTLDEKMKEHKEQSQREQEERSVLPRDDAQIPQPVQSPSNQEPADHSTDSGSADLDNSRVGIEKLNLNSDAALDLLGQPIQGALRAASSSANSDNFSFWSADKKTDDAEAASVAATSVDMDNLSDVTTQDLRESQYYKKPYVEDSPGHEFV